MVVNLADLQARETLWTSQFIRGPVYIQPFTPLLQQQLAAKRPSEPWIWETLDHDDSVVFRNRDYLIVELGRLPGGSRLASGQ